MTKNGIYLKKKNRGHEKALVLEENVRASSFRAQRLAHSLKVPQPTSNIQSISLSL